MICMMSVGWIKEGSGDTGKQITAGLALQY